MFTKVNSKDVVEVMQESDHNFEVEMVPLHMPNGERVYDKMATMRTDTGAYLGTVGKDVKILQPVELYEMAHELIQATGGTITQTMTLHRGSVMGIEFHIDTQEYVVGDPTDLNFIMLTAFNSKYSILGRALSNRLACLNQLASSQKLFNIKKTSGNQPKIDMAMQMLSYYGKEMAGFNEKMNLLTGMRHPHVRAIEFFRNLHPVPKAETRAVARLDNITDEFNELLHNGKGTSLTGVKGTGYGTLQALTEYCNHNRSTRVKEGKTEEEVRFEATTFGSADKLMQKGFEGLLDLAKTDPQDRYVK